MSRGDINCLKAMMWVRNTWAHIGVTLPDKDSILGDLTTLRTFFKLFSNDTETLNEIDLTIKEVENPSEEVKTIAKKTTTKPRKKTNAKTSISSKFDGLEHYLAEKSENQFTLTFSEIESILGFSLCDSAYKYKEYWNPSGHALPTMVLSYGYRIKPDLENQTALFYKVEI